MVGIDMMIKYYDITDLTTDVLKIINIDYEPTSIIYHNDHIYIAGNNQLYSIST